MTRKALLILHGLLCLGCSTIFMGCEQKSDESSHIAADQLFEKSKVILAAYTDSLKIARDSTHVESLARDFELKIDAVNFEFPPETDLKLSQEENDSLIKLTDRLVKARLERLKSFAAKTTDSIPSDSAKQILPTKAAPPSHSPHN